MEGKKNGERFLDYDGIDWQNRIVFDHDVSAKTNLLLESGLFIDNIQKDRNTSIIYLPFIAKLSYTVFSNTSVYVSGELTPYLRPASNYHTEWQAGIRQQLLKAFELDISYGLFSSKILQKLNGKANSLRFCLTYRLYKKIAMIDSWR